MSKKPPAKREPSTPLDGELGASEDFDDCYGVPKALVEQFAPSEPDFLPEEEVRRDAWRARVYAALKKADVEFDATAVIEAVGHDFIAWTILAKRLEQALSDPFIEESPEVSGFVDTILLLIGVGKVSGSAGIFKRILKVAPKKASDALKRMGEASRADVLQRWEADIVAKNPERGRITRIAEKMDITRRRVGMIVDDLANDGVITRRKNFRKGS